MHSVRAPEAPPRTVDGSTAAFHVAHALSDIVLDYELRKDRHAAASDVNAFGEVVMVQPIETSVGAASALLGALSTGVSASVCATSRSLPLMLPNLHQLALSRVPAVFHIATSGLDEASQSCTADLSDVFCVAHTGAVILHSASIQEAHDLAVVAHLAAQDAKLPVLNTFDGKAGAGEIATTSLLDVPSLAELGASLRVKTRRPTPPRRTVASSVAGAMATVEAVTKRPLQPFQYLGSATAEAVVVVMATPEQTSALELACSAMENLGGCEVGVLKVHLLRPWASDLFLAALPVTARRVVVVAATAGARLLLADVAASTHKRGGSAVDVVAGELEGHVASALELLHAATDAAAVPRVLRVAEPAMPEPLRGVAKAVVWDVGAKAAKFGTDLVRALGEEAANHLHAVQRTDAYHPGGAVTSTEVFAATSSFRPPPAASADFVVVNDPAVLASYDVTTALKDSGILLINVAADKEGLGSADDDALDALPAPLKRDVAIRNLKLYTLPTASAPLGAPSNGAGWPLLVALLAMAGQAVTAGPFSHRAAALCGLSPSDLAEGLQAATEGLVRVAVPKQWSGALTKSHSSGSDNEHEEQAEEQAEEVQPLPTRILRPSLHQPTPIDVAAATATAGDGGAATVQGPHVAALPFMFNDAYETGKSLRPSEHEKTYLVKVASKRRLTTHDYDRNVFHIEFDVPAGFKYDIGDALGVFGHNAPADVAAFIADYGLRATDAVVVPQPGGRVEVRTVEHVLTQQLDLFGRPSRRFYAALAEHATDALQKASLEFLASSDGGPAFKKRVEATVTFADLLREFTSARPTIEELLTIVPAIKPRHYSISSAQSMHPTQVHLLVVLVEWKLADGRQRFGHCTRYLDALEVGDGVTVSLKPSVMKLPEDPLAPVVMAGLGTGMAPFRAFVEERAVLAARGEAVGPMVLYFGSRSQFSEYLYGEELELYHQSGILTSLRCAFSRDQPHKVYIQHKLQEDGAQLQDFLAGRGGTFYLCGPTWPAGDVQDAIEGAFVKFGGLSEEKAREAVAEMKEDEKYILEVY